MDEPRGGGKTGKLLNAQQGLYTLVERGCEDGKLVQRSRVISSVSRCLDPIQEFDEVLRCAENPNLWLIVSNTTEAGIVFDESCRKEDAPPRAFPAKLTRLLYERYRLGGPGFVILGCELIDGNGAKLRQCVEAYCGLWELPPDFLRWLRQENTFCSTLVDRIVIDCPEELRQDQARQMGWTDRAMVACEPFAQFVIEAPPACLSRLPVGDSGLPIIITEDCGP